MLRAIVRQATRYIPLDALQGKRSTKYTATAAFLFGTAKRESRGRKAAKRAW
jgi:hypothetical protein